MGNALLVHYTGQRNFTMSVRLRRLRKDGAGLVLVVRLTTGLYPIDWVFNKKIQGHWWDLRLARFQSRADCKQS